MAQQSEKNDEVFAVSMANSLLGKVDLERKKRGESRSLFIRVAIQRALHTKKCNAQPGEIHVPGDRRRLPREVKNISFSGGDQSMVIIRVPVRIPHTLVAKIDSVRRESRAQFVRSAIADELKVRMGNDYDVTDFEIRAPDRAN